MTSIFKKVSRSLQTLFIKPARRRLKTYHGQGETLETRQLLSVSKLWMSGSTLVVKANDSATHVKVRQNGSKVQIEDVTTRRKWNVSKSKVSTVEFQGGSGNDRFVNYYRYLPVRAFGNAGHDYLEGYHGADYLNGGTGNDTLKGYGGNDRLNGSYGNDLIKGGSGNDTVWGGSGNDRIDGESGHDKLIGQNGNDILEGGSGNDTIWGGNGHDTLLGESGHDKLIGQSGNDHINGGSGTDRMWGGSGNDILIAIDNGVLDYVQSDSGRDAVWVDRNGRSSDRMYGNTTSDAVQKVSYFSNSADRTLNGDNISDPKVANSGETYRRFSNNPLYSTRGPRVTDIRQGSIGNCYFLAGLGAIAIDNPTALRQNIVDFNDGTYGVRYGNRFYRVDNQLVVKSGRTTPAYAKLGLQGSMWVAIAEKAWAHYRKGQNSFASTEGGWSVEVNRAFRTRSAADRSFRGFSNSRSLGNYIGSLWSRSQAVTVGFSANSTKSTSGTIVLGHQYTVTGVRRNSAGTVIQITLRNPWGVDGASGYGNRNDGYIKVTPAQLFRLAGRVNGGRV
ncbi:C2 family cysteine protease [Rubinisphaera margarita]|uniref:C2 family cysteine protease n=1 Tax=Rubinisphaera margarita TaxID=2909586 RepID=UPI001EE8C250|nr:C2 family cysteine protease [Rubinisphaera margarita]MCG6155129.1 C2 family cysteine protease [Rubinisphaera margarita]